MSKDRIVSLNLQHAPQDKAATNLAATVILQRKARILDSIANSRVTLREHLRPEDGKLLDDLDSCDEQIGASGIERSRKNAGCGVLETDCLAAAATRKH